MTNKVTVIEVSKGKFWTLPKKIAFTIILAVVTWALFGCSNPRYGDRAVDRYVSIPTPALQDGETDVVYLQGLYAVYNEQYFNNRLTKTPTINIDLNDNKQVANTQCLHENGTDCTISFNMHYAAAPRFAQYVLIHEMCHVKVWSRHIPKGKILPDASGEYYHDRSWRACMLSIDSTGAFRQINIDYYYEDVQ